MMVNICLTVCLFSLGLWKLCCAKEVILLESCAIPYVTGPYPLTMTIVSL